MSPRDAVEEIVLYPSENVRADVLSVARRVPSGFYEYRDILQLTFSGGPSELDYIAHLCNGYERTLDKLATYLQAQIAAGRLLAAAPPRDLALAFSGTMFSFAVVAPTHYGIALAEPERISVLIINIFLSGLSSVLTD